MVFYYSFSLPFYGVLISYCKKNIAFGKYLATILNLLVIGSYVVYLGNFMYLVMGALTLLVYSMF